MRPLRFGLTTPDTSFVFWAFLELGARTLARQLGVEVSLVGTLDAEEQAAAVRRFAHERMDAIIFSPASPTAIPNPRAVASGIPVIAIEGAGVEDATIYLQTDGSKAAYLATSYVIERLGGQCRIAHIPGAGPSGYLRSQGFHQAVARYLGVQVVWDNAVDWSRAGAEQSMSAALQAHPDLQAVFAHSDEMALGAIAAIEKAKRTGTILVAGVDAMPAALMALDDGTLAATASLEPYQLGMQAVDAAVRTVRGEPVASQMLLDVELVTSETLRRTALIQLGRLPTLLLELSATTKRQLELQEQIITAQHSTIQELSSPILPINDNTLVLPLIGAIDTRRAAQVMESTLDAVVRHQADIIVIDITGVSIIDTQVAHHLLQLAQSVKLLGAKVILVGVTPEVAQTVVQLGVDLSSLITRSTLKGALAYAAEQSRKSMRNM